MQATCVYQGGKLQCVIINEKRTSGLDIIGTFLQIQLQCSGRIHARINNFHAVNGNVDEKQLFCMCAVLFQKHYVADSSWDALDDNSRLWDEAVKAVLDECNQPFQINVQILVD